MASRGICIYCHENVAIKKDGRLMKHGAGAADRKLRGDRTYRGCSGTNTKPKALYQPVKKTGPLAEPRSRRVVP